MSTPEHSKREREHSQNISGDSGSDDDRVPPPPNQDTSPQGTSSPCGNLAASGGPAQHTGERPVGGVAAAAAAAAGTTTPAVADGWTADADPLALICCCVPHAVLPMPLRAGTAAFLSGDDCVLKTRQDACDCVTTVKLSDASAPVSITRFLSELPKVTALDLANGAVGVEFVNAIVTMDQAKGPEFKLRSLDLNWCRKLDADVLLEVEKLTELRTLCLIGAKMKPAMCDRVTKLVNLTALDLSNCEGLDDDCFECLPNLAKLVELDLSETDVCSGVLAHVGKLPQLRRLDLGEVDIDDDGVDAIGRIKTLEVLNLGYCNLDLENTIEAITALPNLRELDLRFCESLTIEDLGAVSRLQKLEVLNISGCAIGDMLKKWGDHLTPSEGRPAALSCLHTLRMSGCNIDSVCGLPQLARLPQLQCLDIAGSSVSAEEVAELVQTAPMLKALDDVTIASLQDMLP